MLRIAEIGSNYRSFADILLYIDQLAADVIKLQHYDSMDLYGVPDRCKSVMLSDGDLEEAKFRCNQNGKELMISFFNHENVKVSSSEKIRLDELRSAESLEEMRQKTRQLEILTEQPLQ